MQLVVMAAVLALAGAGQDCLDCHLTSYTIEVESCGTTEYVNTTVCVGHCYNEDPVYISHHEWPEQKICNGDWSEEVKFIEGCPEAVKYPVARNCNCIACNTEKMHCGRDPAHIPNCVAV
ncbi:gonadotropin subunit beta-1-like [Embiotoca jacksoni]|uniref:gonadotropin subunit beta-1-like n=1 Tax=Embiotoca jacksoni TaxID=100190 RepID=UPI003703CB10